jgi:hypothetical protein
MLEKHFSYQNLLLMRLIFIYHPQMMVVKEIKS